MPGRREFLPQVVIGDILLPRPQAHHLRDVLRLQPGAELEVFDDAGNRANATILQCDSAGVVVRIQSIVAPEASPGRLRIASAIPKSTRADWLVEKLSEMGVDQWIPLHCQRGVVLPEGKNKFARWQRLAIEAARQSGRTGTMNIGDLITVADLLAERSPITWYMSPRQSLPIFQAIQPIAAGGDLLLLIGPEGGWADEEIAQFRAANLSPIKLTQSILRIETAALAAAAVLRCWQAGA